jgi:peptidoglycan/LPS O-acetylase OafA/YrhL
MNNSEAVSSKESSRSHLGTRVPGLDALRGFAIALVLAYHVAGVTFVPNKSYGPLSTVFDSLWIGVDIFFVLSGFLITTGLIASRSRQKYYQDFYVKRSFRLLPLYYFAFFAFTAIPMVRRTHPSFALILCYVFYVQNWAMAAGHWIKGTAHFWSLAIEEQFYIFWPAICRKLSNLLLLRLSLGLFASSLILRLYLRYFMGTKAWPLYTMTFTHLDGIALGSAVAVALSDSRFRKFALRAARLTFPLSIATLVILILTLPHNDENLDVYTWLPTITSICAACAVIHILARGIVFKGVVGKTFERLGIYSYSIYLFHPFFIPFLYTKAGKFAFDTPAFLRSLTPFSAALATAFIFLAFFVGAFIFGHLVYRLVEVPIASARRRFLTKASQYSSETAVVRTEIKTAV